MVRCLSPARGNFSLEPLSLHITHNVTLPTALGQVSLILQCVQVIKTGDILTNSSFHGVLNWVRLGHGQGCPLTVSLSTRALGMLSWLQGLRGLSLGVTHREDRKSVV